MMKINQPLMIKITYSQVSIYYGLFLINQGRAGLFECQLQAATVPFDINMNAFMRNKEKFYPTHDKINFTKLVFSIVNFTPHLLSHIGMNASKRNEKKGRGR